MLQGVNPEQWDVEGLEALRTEFYETQNETDHYSRMASELQTRGGNLDLSESGRASDLVVIREAGPLIGVMWNKYYRWSLIRQQLYFKLHYKGNEPTGLSLQPLKSLNPFIEEEPHAVGELAYFWVSPERRGQGYGDKLFQRAMSDFQRFLTHPGDLAMTIAQGNQAKSDVGKRIKAYLLDLEKETNGVNPLTDKIDISGLVVSSKEILTKFGIDLPSLCTLEKSKGTEVLAIKHGMSFVGLSSNLSRVFLKRV